MTAADDVQVEHDLRCASWNSDDPTLCTCRDAQGWTPGETWADRPMLALDFESTGTDPLTARIVTACVIDIRPGRKPATRNWLTDVDGEVIPSAASDIHGVTTEHAHAHGRPQREVVEEVAAAVSTAWTFKVPVVGYNIGTYDLSLLAAECARLDLAPFQVTGPVIDGLTLDRGVDRYRRGKRTLSAACEHYGVRLSADDAHSADADALAAARVAWMIARRYRVIGEMPLPALMRWQADSHRRWADEFGRYLVRNGKVDDVVRTWPLRSAEDAS